MSKVEDGDLDIRVSMALVLTGLLYIVKQEQWRHLGDLELSGGDIKNG